LRHHEHVFRDTRDSLAIERDSRIRPPSSDKSVGTSDIDDHPRRLNAGTVAPQLREHLGLRQCHRLRACGRRHKSGGYRGAREQHAHNTSIRL
jgi:hypothetical protein